MKALVYKSKQHVSIEDVPDPRIEDANDVVVKLTTSGICGSDLHMYEGRSPVEAGLVFGHENMGIVDAVGSSVKTIAKGDRVVLPFNIGCGFCFNCTRGYSSACLTVNPESAGGGYGYSGLGPFPGGQAEYLRVPFADYNCLKLPGTPGDEFEDDFLLLSDIFPTGFHATELAKVGVGDTVAIFGAGPVGLLAALSAKIKGASEIYVVDSIPERLQKAESVGAIGVDVANGDPVEQILELRKKHVRDVQNLRPGAGDKMPGVMCGIDAIGYEAKSDDKPGRDNVGHQRGTQALENLIELVNPTGHIGIIGVYFPKDPGGKSQDEKNGIYPISIGMAWNKGITIGMGQAPVKKYNVYLRDLIIAGKAKPSFIVSHRIPLAEAPAAYEKFDKRSEGYTKVLIKPQLHSN
ncbi:MAG: glutathione-independent formaldehyde dehydrogenase [Candidatus Eremiobacteraeota bacterium]|nr:glutathione-independent formaldehyde dehydrogenase [Candidatus Eremiobacteraeota bacterium]